MTFSYYFIFDRIGNLHDGVIWLQLPESFTLSVSYANQGNCYLNPTGTWKLNKKEKTKEILVVVVKWRQRANLLFMRLLRFFHDSKKKGFRLKRFPPKFPLLPKLYIQTSQLESCCCHLFKTFLSLWNKMMKWESKRSEIVKEQINRIRLRRVFKTEF